MTAREYLNERNPSYEQTRNQTGHDDAFMEQMMEGYATQQKEDIKNLLFLAKEMCGIHHPFLQTYLYKRLELETK